MRTTEFIKRLNRVTIHAERYNWKRGHIDADKYYKVSFSRVGVKVIKADLYLSTWTIVSYNRRNKAKSFKRLGESEVYRFLTFPDKFVSDPDVISAVEFNKRIPRERYLPSGKYKFVESRKNRVGEEIYRGKVYGAKRIFKDEREAAVWVDKILLKKGKQPVNILKKVIDIKTN